MKRQIEHGSALFVAVIVVLIISVMAVGLIRMGSLEVAGALAGAKREALSSCVEAATKLLVSRFHVLGTDPTQIDVLNVSLDGAGGTVRAVGGHIQTEVQVEQVTAMNRKASGPERVDDDTNVIRDPNMKKAPLRVVVHCQIAGTPGDETSGRQAEVELGVRFGM